MPLGQASFEEDLEKVKTKIKHLLEKVYVNIPFFADVAIEKIPR